MKKFTFLLLFLLSSCTCFTAPDYLKKRICCSQENTHTEIYLEKPSIEFLYKRHKEDALETMSLVRHGSKWFITFRELIDTRPVTYTDLVFECKHIDGTPDHTCPLHEGTYGILGLWSEDFGEYHVYLKRFSSAD